MFCDLGLHVLMSGHKNFTLPPKPAETKKKYGSELINALFLTQEN